MLALASSADVVLAAGTAAVGQAVGAGSVSLEQPAPASAVFDPQARKTNDSTLTTFDTR